MLQNITTKRREFHEHIRKRQIEHLFRGQRERMLNLPSKSNKELLIEALQHTKLAVQERNYYNIQKWLQQYIKIGQNYRIEEAILSSAILSHKLPQVRQGILPVECSYGQLFIHAMQEQYNPHTRNQLLQILRINIYQMRFVVGIHTTSAKQLLQTTIDALPFEWCQDMSLWTSFLQLLGEIMVFVHLTGFNLHLANKEINIGNGLKVIGDHQQFVKQQSQRKVYIETSILFFTVFDYSDLKVKNCQIVKNVQKLICSDIQTNYQNLGRNCQYFRRLWMLGTNIHPQCLQYLLKYVDFAVQTRCFEYFQAINTALAIKKTTIPHKLFESILIFIFTEKCSFFKQQESLQMKQWMILILKRYFQFKRLCWNNEELIKFTKILDNNMFALSQILIQIKNYNSQSMKFTIQMIDVTMRQLFESGKMYGNLDIRIKELFDEVDKRKINVQND